VVESLRSSTDNLRQASAKSGVECFRFHHSPPRAFLCLFAFSSSLCAAASQPNIIIHFIDDLGYGDIGPFGAVKQKTPHLDRMAREGMKLTSFYAAPVCSVSRAQILTGCYGARVSVPGVYGPGSKKRACIQQEHTIADAVLQAAAGEATPGQWYIGNWQWRRRPTGVFADEAGLRPLILGIPYSNADARNRERGTARGVVPLVRDEQVVQRLLEVKADQDRIEDVYTDEAVKFIRCSTQATKNQEPGTKNTAQPFFLYFPAHRRCTRPSIPAKPSAAPNAVPFWRLGAGGRCQRRSRSSTCCCELQLDQNTLVIFNQRQRPLAHQRRRWRQRGSPCAGGRQHLGKAACASARSRGGPARSRPAACAMPSPAPSTCCPPA